MRKNLSLCLVVSGTLVLMSACSGTSGNSDEGSDQKLTRIVIGVPAVSATFSDIFVGIDQGFFAKHGLDVSVKQVLGAQTIAGLKSGDLDMMDAPATSGATAIMTGSELVFVAMPSQRYNLQVWAQPEIKSVADLAGKKVGVAPPGSLSYLALPDLLAQANMSASDVVPTVLDQPGQMAAMKSGSIAATLSSPPLSSQLASQGMHMVADLSNIPFPTNTYTVTKEYYDSHKEALKDFVAAEAEILPYLQDHKKETIASMARHTGVENAAANEAAYDFYQKVWSDTPAVPEDLIALGFKRSAEALKKAPPTDISKYTVYSLLS